MKFPLDFNMKLVFRMILPGLILSFGLYPILDAIFKEPDSLRTAFAVCVISSGWLLVLSYRPIYMLLEGRRYWFGPLLNFMLKKEKKRLMSLLKRKDFFEENNDAKYLETLADLQCFPKNDKDEYQVEYPTRLGNLLRSYEQYSYRCYGMSAVFYWYRIWLMLDKDTREEIDNQQALADSAVFASFGFWICGALSVAYACLKAVTLDQPSLLAHLQSSLPTALQLLSLAILAFVAGYGLYRASIHSHAEFGEVFKSIFDMYRSKVAFDDIVADLAIGSGKPVESIDRKEKYKMVWRYLQYSKLPPKA